MKYTELDIGRWRTRGRATDEGFTQFGVTPVLRLYPSGIGHGWFAEAGIGANWISRTNRPGCHR
jgi:lipid A 3-O-deacylase